MGLLGLAWHYGKIRLRGALLSDVIVAFTSGRLAELGPDGRHISLQTKCSALQVVIDCRFLLYLSGMSLLEDELVKHTHKKKAHGKRSTYDSINQVSNQNNSIKRPKSCWLTSLCSNSPETNSICRQSIDNRITFTLKPKSFFQHLNFLKYLGKFKGNSKVILFT